MLVSIVIPCFNGEDFIADCFESLANQQSQNFEVIFVNDASQDSSLAMAKTLISQHGLKGQILSNDVNLGEARSVNKGILAASGNLCIVLSVDDLLEPQATKLIGHAYAQNSKAVGWYGDWFVRSNSGDTLVDLSRRASVEQMVKNFDCLPSVGSAFSLGMSEGRPQREPEWGPVADFDFWLDLASKGDLVYIPATLGIWRENDASQTSRGHCTIAEKKIALARKYSERAIGGYVGGKRMRISALIQAQLLQWQGNCPSTRNPLKEAMGLSLALLILKLMQPSLGYTFLISWKKYGQRRKA